MLLCAQENEEEEKEGGGEARGSRSEAPRIIGGTEVIIT